MWLRIFVSTLIVVAGCTPPEREERPVPEVNRLEFKMVTQERTVDDCIGGAEGCVYARLDYPVLVDAPDGYAVNAVTDAVFSWVTADFAEEGSYATVEMLMEGFIDAYRTSGADTRNGEPAWFLERKVFVLHNTPDVVSWSLAEHVHTGDAHPTSTITFVNLDPRTGETVGLSDVLVDGYEDDLLPIAEARFREVWSIDEGTALTDAGFTFDDDTFSLTENFSIGERGLTFYYNPDEIAPYERGPTEIVLSYDELDGLLQEGLPWIDESG